MNGQPAQLLVVDDQAVNRMIYKRALQQDGAEVAEAACGDAALDFLAGNRVDLVLMDVMMSDMSGFEVARRIHDRYGEDGPPVVFITAFDPSEQDKARAFAMGGVDFFHKPTDLNELRRKVGGLVRMHRQKLEIADQLLRLERERTEIAALLQAARDIMSSNDFPTVARSIFDRCRTLTGAQAGYVALLSADGLENELLFLEAGGMPCFVDPTLPMPIRGLREQAYRTGHTVVHNDFRHSEWQAQLPGGHLELRNVLFAPLNIDGAVVGIMGLANKPGDFTENDLALAGNFGELAALALHNARNVAHVQQSNRLMNAAEDLAGLGAFEYCGTTGSLVCSEGLRRVLNLPPEPVPVTLQDVTQCISSSEQPRVMTCLRQAVAEKTDVELEFHAGTDSRERIFHLQARHISTGNADMLVGACQDISRTRRMEAQAMLTRKLDAVGQLAAGLAHEINTPLQYMTGNLSFVESTLNDIWERFPEADSDGTRQETSAALSDCRDGVHRIEHIIHSLTRFTHSTASGQTYTDLPTLFNDVVILSRNALDQVAELRMDLPTDLQPADLLPAELGACLLNLVMNAADSIREAKRAGTITLGARQSENRLHLWVRDNGTGIPAEIRQKIFDPFFTTREPGQGTGMGLAEVFASIRRLGGQLWFETSEGSGTTFHMTLPLHESPAV